MVRVLHFVQKPEARSYGLQGIGMGLEINERIFPPSPQGSFFAEHIRVAPGETVIDVGTGSGIFGILAAKLGGKVCATDTSKDAIELSEKNARSNNVRIEFSQGSYFSDFAQKFDVIIANLPQEIVHENYQKAIGRELTESISGGADGNEKLLEFLDIAKGHMHSNSRAYIPIYTATDYMCTLRKIAENYNAKLIAFCCTSTREFVEDNIEWYLDLNKKGKIKIFKRCGKWLANEYIFELTLKGAAPCFAK
jgi:methylase of polypeptide subunit release factors